MAYGTRQYMNGTRASVCVCVCVCVLYVIVIIVVKERVR